MMRKTRPLMALGASILLLALACSQTEPITAPQTFAEAKVQATQADKPMLIDFFATW